MGEDNLKNKSFKELVAECEKNSVLEVDDLAKVCGSIIELVEGTELALKKGLRLHSKKQKWYNMNYSNENPVLTILRLYQLHKQISSKK